MTTIKSPTTFSDEDVKQDSQMMATVQNANNTSVVEWNALDNLASDTANNASEEKQCLNVSILLSGHFREE